MNKEMLIDALDELDFNEGFDIFCLVSHFTFGVRKVDLIDTKTIVFGAYGGSLTAFALEQYTTEEITNKIEEAITGYNHGKYISLEDHDFEEVDYF